ncbi:unnamed protein product [Meloidogyne enterolobii]|uniref:Uncharacterized protein n=1 Tax=Meloidogyne enterolobii TaxID=390850 RepID=A0ACB1B5S8_MELEN
MLAILISVSILFLSVESSHEKDLQKIAPQNCSSTLANQTPTNFYKEKDCRCTYPAEKTNNLTKLPLRVLKRSCGGCCCCCGFLFIKITRNSH